MKFSFYRNLTWVIGILVAVEIYLQMGVHRGLWLMIADLLIVLILTFLFHRLRTTGANSGAFDPNSVSNVINTKSESEWQKKHDQWWQAYRQMNQQPVAYSVAAKSQHAAHMASITPTSSSSSVNVQQLEHSNQELKEQIDYLNRKIALVHNNQDTESSSYQHSTWYKQVMQMKRQIAKLKSEYK